MSTTVHAVKDAENQRPVPSEWRESFSDIIRALVNGDYALESCASGVAPLSPEIATQIEEYIRDYGETLIELPPESWDSSVCIWMNSWWEVLVDLWTESEGRSDLVLSARVTEAGSGYVFEAKGVYVP